MMNTQLFFLLACCLLIADARSTDFEDPEDLSMRLAREILTVYNQKIDNNNHNFK